MTDAPQGDAWDNLQSWSRPNEHWSTTNVRENLPLVPSPLGWSLWEAGSENCIRYAAFALGAFSRAERKVPADTNDRYARIFYGHYALQFEYLTTLGDRLPGTSGQEVAAGLLGRVPEDIEYSPTKRRYPVIAWRLPLLQLRVP